MQVSVIYCLPLCIFLIHRECSLFSMCQQQMILSLRARVSVSMPVQKLLFFFHREARLGFTTDAIFALITFFHEIHVLLF